MNQRDDFSESVKKKLAERAGYKCSNPFCRKTTIGAQKGGEGSVNVGEAAHICAAAPGGKRYDSKMTQEQRKSYENGIWLCRTHAALIDRDEKCFTKDLLKEWKEKAEKESSDAILGVSEEAPLYKAKFRLFYDDLTECKKFIDMLESNRNLNIIIDVANFPLQTNWEENAEKLASFIGTDLVTNLIKILREIEEMKRVMEEERERIKPRQRVADMGSVRYGGRYRIFLERMEEWLSNDFMEELSVFLT